ncbi:MAG: pyruvate ferredoxin oxidoreductase [Planctomycetes bacterium]|jgi:pyruvate ferredoxin oxidoreductase alpha subunit|nr:pyruvate ferredoxin oxidoreductase [Planctomycetota bacterium]
MKNNNKNTQLVEGSHAIALTIKNIQPDVVAAYPITPQTHIVEDLASFQANKEADFEYVRTESEFAAASVILGASAAGSRVYSATSSQGLLLMNEVIYCISGMRLPIVMTLANRTISAPINIWNDQSDAMTVRDSGWLMLFAESNQEAVEQHIMAYKLAEQLKIPVLVNVDGFILTHSYEAVSIPSTKEIKKYLPDYKATKGEYLDVNNPVTLGALVSPLHYQAIRQELHDDLISSLNTINKEYENYKKIIGVKVKDKKTIFNNGLVEYYGSKKAKNLIVVLGSISGTIKDFIDNNKKNDVALLRLKVYRPFPAEQVSAIIKNHKQICVLDKAIDLGNGGPLALDVMAAANRYLNKIPKIKSFVSGLGGKEINKETIKNILISKNNNSETIFL